jgi:preprotein translocase subunit SecA
VTIATNMAGRGTDIVLGGSLEVELGALGAEVDEAARAQIRSDWQTRHEKVVAAGGLHIIGTERHESRRIDNQLRGRSGRQGDPGSSRFYLSMEDNLMRIFGDPNRTKRLLQFAGMKSGEVIESGMLTRQIEKAQRKVEAHNFDIRKQLLLFDDVANDQRKVIYQQRTAILGTNDMSGAILEMLDESVGGLVDGFVAPGSAPQDWNLEGLQQAVQRDFNVAVSPADWVQQDRELEAAMLRRRVVEAVRAAYEQKVARVGGEVMHHVERQVVLQTLDQHWRDHLAAMDYLRQGIHLRGYAQKDYRYEYKREAFELFSAMLDRVKFDTVSRLATVEIKTQEQLDREEAERRDRLMRALQAQHAELQSLLGGGEAEMLPQGPVPALAGAAAVALGMPGAQAGMRGGAVPLQRPRTAPPMPQSASAAPFVREGRKVGRNEPCPCGSGKKFKHCHGALASTQ